MSQVQQKLEELIEAIRESAEYKEYHEAKASLKRDSLLAAKADEFRRRNFELQNNMADEKLYDAVEEIRREYEELCSRKEMDDFLQAENRYCRLLRRVNQQILENADFDIRFLM